MAHSVTKSNIACVGSAGVPPAGPRASRSRGRGQRDAAGPAAGTAAFLARQRYGDCCAAADSAREINTATVEQHYFARERQAEAVAAGAIGLEREEEARNIARVETGAIVDDRDARLRLGSDTDIDAACAFRAHRLRCVADEIFERAREQRGIAGKRPVLPAA